MNPTERIVIDLDGTLTINATNQLRPGAKALLDKLEKGERINFVDVG